MKTAADGGALQRHFQSPCMDFFHGTLIGKCDIFSSLNADHDAGLQPPESSGVCGQAQGLGTRSVATEIALFQGEKNSAHGVGAFARTNQDCLP